MESLFMNKPLKSSQTRSKDESSAERSSYNYVIHTSSFSAQESEHYHWHVEIMPKLTKVAGFEWGTGFTSTLPS